MTNRHVKLQPEIDKRLQQEVDEGKWDSISEAMRYYLQRGMELENKENEELEKLREDMELWREQAMRLSKNGHSE